jgi:hypothetical protein
MKRKNIGRTNSSRARGVSEDKIMVSERAHTENLDIDIVNVVASVSLD